MKFVFEKYQGPIFFPFFGNFIKMLTLGMLKKLHFQILQGCLETDEICLLEVTRSYFFLFYGNFIKMLTLGMPKKKLHFQILQECLETDQICLLEISKSYIIHFSFLFYTIFLKCLN